MSQQDALRRIEKLEQQAQRVDIHPLAEEAAERLGFNVDELLAETERLARRVDEIGFGAVTAELDADAARVAERSGITVEQLNADVDQFFGERDWQPS